MFQLLYEALNVWGGDACYEIDALAAEARYCHGLHDVGTATLDKEDWHQADNCRGGRHQQRSDAVQCQSIYVLEGLKILRSGQ